MRIIEKDSSNVKVETEILEYEENFDFEMMWEYEIDIEEDNVLNNYNSIKALVMEAEESKRTYEE